MFAISRVEWLTGKSKICEDMKMVYRTLSVNEAEQFFRLMNQLDYYMARVRKILVYTTMTYDISRYRIK